MDDINLLNEAAGEITRLRAQNQMQGARLQMFDDLMLVFRSAPNYPQSGMMAEDIVWKLNQAVKEAQAPKGSDKMN